ncbi:hypothetical protein ARALYDRAFT_915072 [Arabidopsis lyrata subsp. lyrata]|uniref:TFIIS-type domain-containing protein n=1 Tax=Arabidopsis lyrata subsp. lyrata TaxID=81972 RepID=D7M9S4_ARALL|nr:hypothetical protein ARALYDRAFT_915072 [Arabidopsis lyrata subsp. lyrata]
MEDKEQSILLYACRNCDHQEAADNNCVYRNEVHHSTVLCTKCQHGEAVFFQVNHYLKEATAKGEEGMTLFFVCYNPNCSHRWRE